MDDLAQETFLTAWQRMDCFDRDRDFGKWLRGIARNLVLNERRKTARRARIMSARLTEILEATTGEEEPVDDAWMQVQLGIMRDCLDQVPEKTRSTLVRRYQSDESAAGLAAHVGVSVTAVRQILCRVRKAVRDCMEERRGMLEA